MQQQSAMQFDVQSEDHLSEVIPILVVITPLTYHLVRCYKEDPVARLFDGRWVKNASRCSDISS